jgi:hypothetical protein
MNWINQIGLKLIIMTRRAEALFLKQIRKKVALLHVDVNLSALKNSFKGNTTEIMYCFVSDAENNIS